MRRPNFGLCNELATDLLLKQNLENRITNVRNLKYDKDIVFESIQNYARLVKKPLNAFLSKENDILKDGCTITRDALHLILYNESITNFEHLNWTLAHEVGHVYLGHTSDEDVDEIEAHYFAAQLLMPEYSLYRMASDYGPLNVRAVVEVFGVSSEAAYRRINAMSRKTIISSDLKHRKIFDAQKEKIEMYYDCLENHWDYRACLDYSISIKYEMEHELESNLMYYYA